MNIGSYQVIRLLGKGGMSEVFEVANDPGGLHYALKLFCSTDGDELVRQRFVNEGRLLVKLNHPRIVRVFDVGVDGQTGRPYFVMDLVVDADGKVRTLADVPEGSVDEETVGKWYDDIRDGLSYIHAKGIVHRDLKLQNVLVGPDGHAVIADFGICKVSEESKASFDSVDTLIRVQAGRMPLMGSLGYMAPELEMGVAASPRSDWFALGVVVYKLLTGGWYDAHADLAGTLSTYDPAWGVIVPKLLHSNPNGRECPAYSEVKAKLAARRELEWEDRLSREQRKARSERRFVYALCGLLALTMVMSGFAVRRLHSQRDAWRAKCANSAIRPSVPTFEELFRIPAEAKAEEQADADGTVTMYSRSDFEAARVDALVITEPVFANLMSGVITIEKATLLFERISERLDPDSEESLFDRISFGGNDYVPLGESGPLKMLIDRAVERMKAASEQ